MCSRGLRPSSVVSAPCSFWSLTTPTQVSVWPLTWLRGGRLHPILPPMTLSLWLGVGLTMPLSLAKMLTLTTRLVLGPLGSRLHTMVGPAFVAVVLQPPFWLVVMWRALGLTVTGRATPIPATSPYVTNARQNPLGSQTPGLGPLGLFSQSSSSSDAAPSYK